MSCVVCGSTEFGGLSTYHDPYGDRKHVGLQPVVDSAQHYCWDHAEIGYEKSRVAEREVDTAFAAAGLCGFLQAWVGRCRQPQPCAKHAAETCWKCGRRAVRNCSHTGSLVCGVPECAEHPHEHGRNAERRHREGLGW